MEAPGYEGHRLLAGVDEVGVDFGIQRVRAHAKDAVFRLQRDRYSFGNIVANQCGHADAEVDVVAVL